MEAQLKRGLIEICVLAAIREQDSYGYQIIKDISSYLAISESTLYPILRRLEKAGSLTVYTVEYNSRLRKYYSITDQGLERIDQFIAEWPLIEQMYHFIVGGSKHDT